MTDLHTDYLGLRLRSPIVALPGPLTGDLDQIMELERAGVGAVVLPSLFEEQIEHETNEIDRLFSLHSDSFGEAATMLPELDSYNNGVDRYLEHVEAVKRSVDIPVIAQSQRRQHRWMAAVRPAARRRRRRCDRTEPLRGRGRSDRVIGSSRSPNNSDWSRFSPMRWTCRWRSRFRPSTRRLHHSSWHCRKPACWGVVMFNRFDQPDLDLETLDVQPRLALSSPEELRLPLRWTGIMHEHLSMSIAASTGVYSGHDVAKLVLVGADVAMTTLVRAALRRRPRRHHRSGAAGVDARTRLRVDRPDERCGAQRGSCGPVRLRACQLHRQSAAYTSRHMSNHPIGLQHGGE